MAKCHLNSKLICSYKNGDFSYISCDKNSSKCS